MFYVAAALLLIIFFLYNKAKFKKFIQYIFCGILLLLFLRLSNFYLFILSGLILYFISLKKNIKITNPIHERNSSKLSRDEAASILGVSPDASKEEIKKVYYKLMQKIHPDKGGNEYLANQLINAYKRLTN